MRMDPALPAIIYGRNDYEHLAQTYINLKRKTHPEKVWKKALRIWRKLLKAYPDNDGARKRMEEARRRIYSIKPIIDIKNR